MKYQYFNGVKFTRDDKTGYYLNSTIRKRMHRYVWEYYYGEIPKGYQIHHLDHDKSNNDISNLQPMIHGEHASLHAMKRAKEHYDEMIENLNTNARPKANEWHKSSEGSEWHKKHYENTKDKLHSKYKFECEQCGNEFVGVNNGANRFCSNKCKSKWRRDNGLDDEIRECVYCGKSFAVNKYRNTRTCSRSCANRQRAKVRKNKIN
ncbi:HNH endonuclease signature motif containing protein [Staphylococcus saprophyticus]|uniref:HNH endonuclease signature motif containing protein n=1 Tax=Staphylococcus saprophyticus TaxID=29385 RepID=UPI0022EB0904|nr:HNH endonuclease signature motif containing protein [Staphylococcus saprophyticus]MDW3782140.1 HNH endonuclease signature motif containing protein [Staphylococcus saprophyticus]MDW3925707.1 HNH endonuclease signature motif containing protein [Staphylococcus saprophyticus]MDW3953110.1 HNH endonuclease signature motif containing protein [Staphylococcus saprophyticus]MDW4022619.1 HNH endonuclease signature motif containing protein [Staphylococcus saprophyticus]